MSALRTLRLGTRGSELALWQARWARDRLAAAYPGLAVEIIEVHSAGDVDLVTPLFALGEVGVFTQALERELAAGRIDVAVHSLKDVPAKLAGGMTIAAHSPREDVRDVWFHRDGVPLAQLRKAAKVATGSLRRRCQLLAMRRDLNLVGLRGNVNTRWRKFEEGQFDAMILAAAGVLRLGWRDRITAFLEPETLLPAVGQGIIGLETRADDPAAALVASIDDHDASICARAERALLAAVAGGCVVPLAGYCLIDGSELWLRARLGRPDGTVLLRAEARGAPADLEGLGRRVAEQILGQGGAEIVAETKAAAAEAAGARAAERARNGGAGGQV
jgi:hydroxymethylbilane synthase